MFSRDSIKKILIFEVGCIGDTLATIPALKVMREKFPDAHIDRVSVPMVRELLDICPYVDDIILYDREEQERGLAGKIRFLFKIRKRRYDIFINLHIPSPHRKFSYYLRDNLFAYLTGARYRVGYWVRGTGMWLTDGPLADNMDRRPAASAILELANCIIKDDGIGDKSGNIALKESKYLLSTNVDEEAIDILLGSYGINHQDLVIGIHPCSRHGYTRWIDERFASVADELISRYNAKVIFTGTSDDIDMIKNITGLMKQDAVILAGRTTLRQLAAIIKRCRIYISVDTGPIHMAVAIGTPTISIFSGRDFPEKWAPNRDIDIVLRKDISCSPCFKQDCDDNKCMKMIEVSNVLGAVERLICLKSMYCM